MVRIDTQSVVVLGFALMASFGTALTIRHLEGDGMAQAATPVVEAAIGASGTDAQVVKETSMAETQRKTQKDQADLQIAQQKLQKDMAEHQMDNQTKIAIKNAELTHETIQNVAQAQQQPGLPAPQLQ